MAQKRKGDQQTTLYRFFDQDGELLYIGISSNPGRRFSEHGKHKLWWGQVAESTMEHFPSRREAEDAERRAIKAEHPRYNIVHAPQVQVAVVEPTIELVCALCGGVVAPGRGYLQVDPDLAADCARRGSRQMGGLITAADLMQMDLSSAPWMGMHGVCDLDPQGREYWIGADSLTTWAEVVEFFAHVAAKPWAMEGTDLTRVMRQLATPGSSGPLRVKAAA